MGRLMNGREYLQSLRRLKPTLYFMGRRIESVADEPMLRPHVQAAALTYELAHDPRYRELLTATSHLTGERINRFTHIHQGPEDLVKKVEMMRLLGQKTGSCFQRCVGLDALNSLYIVTYEIDQKLGTEYHRRFVEYLKRVQKEDLMCTGSVTDVKGDRSLRPHEQPDPDLYVRVVERREDGIVVRGAKAHQTGASNSHEVVVLPTRAMGPEDRDYAVAFSVPVDAPGLIQVLGRQTNDTRRLEGEIDCGNPKYGIVGGETLMIFNDVFVPWERVFMCGEHEFAGRLVEVFATFHRQNYGGCKVGVADVLIGASALLAEYSGIAGSPHVEDKLTEMIHLAETCWCCSLACSYRGLRTPSGAYWPDPLLANVVKLNITRLPFEWSRLAQDLAGGLITTAPSEKDLRSPEVGRLVEKYLARKEGVPAEHILRLFRLVENLAVGGGLPECMHGAGSPQAQKIVIRRRGGVEEKKRLARIIAGLERDEHLEKILGKG
jgi:4-hydroxybutyryl-CoA dehydratase/vinylacetyl-CoA-Delta-isomerase